MGREIRRVPKDWYHPRNQKGDYIPLYYGDGDQYRKEKKEWDKRREKWQLGLCEQYGDDEKWGEIDPEYKNMRYTDYSGAIPSPDDYMPNWAEDECTHMMMYETCSEGTPISPAFETSEELAWWLADNNASAFGRSTATYEQWLNTCKVRWAPSAIIDSNGLHSGVEAMAEKD